MPINMTATLGMKAGIVKLVPPRQYLVDTLILGRVIYVTHDSVAVLWLNKGRAVVYYRSDKRMCRQLVALSEAEVVEATLAGQL